MRAETVRVPANVDQEDRLLAGLTARQLGYLAAGGLLAWTLHTALHPIVPAAVEAALLVPVALVVAVVTVGRRDGIPGDRFAAAWLRHLTRPRRLVPAPDGVPARRPWMLAAAPVAPLPVPVRRIDADGVIDLGRDGAALVCTASSTNFGLRTPAEKKALVAALARWLNALDGPVQIIVRAERIDVAALVRQLDDAAGGLAHPALEDAARDHARYLGALAARRDVLRRRVLVVFRAPGPLADAAVLLTRRPEEANSALAAAGVVLAPLDGAAAVAVFAAAADPGRAPLPAGLALPGQVLTGAAA